MSWARRRVRHFGLRRRCPICGSRLRRFAPLNQRPESVCPVCGSLERHRHLFLYLERHTDLLRRPQTLLHVAPDPALHGRLSRVRGLRSITGDLEGGRGEQTLDLTALALEDESVDAALVIHVLEHIPDDAAAFGELQRVLRPGGWAVLQVPWKRGPTLEDPSVTTAEERLRRFGQADHVRMYGDDFPARIERAGLRAEVVVMRDEIPAHERARMGLEYPGAPDPADPLIWSVVVARKP